MGAGKGWSSAENLRACKAFLIASEDPIKGTSQKAKTFALTIENAFSTLLHEETKENGLLGQHRSGSSIFQRYKRTKKECIDFEKFHHRVLAADLRGSTSHDDILVVVTALYNNVCTGSVKNMYSFIGTDATSPGKRFQFQNCYTFLTSTQLWEAIRASVSITRNMSSESGVLSEGTLDIMKPGDQMKGASLTGQKTPLFSEMKGRQTSRP